MIINHESPKVTSQVKAVLFDVCSIAWHKLLRVLNSLTASRHWGVVVGSLSRTLSKYMPTHNRKLFDQLHQIWWLKMRFRPLTRIRSKQGDPIFYPPTIRPNIILPLHLLRFTKIQLSHNYWRCVQWRTFNKYTDSATIRSRYRSGPWLPAAIDESVFKHRI